MLEGLPQLGRQRGWASAHSVGTRAGTPCGGRQEENNQKRFENREKNFDEEKKAEYIKDVEFELKKKGMKEEKLNTKLEIEFL